MIYGPIVIFVTIKEIEHKQITSSFDFCSFLNKQRFITTKEMKIETSDSETLEWVSVNNVNIAWCMVEIALGLFVDRTFLRAISKQSFYRK